MTRKRLARRRQIIETATSLFSSRGYHATRMQDIAEALDMQAGSLYYYFESKEALLTAIVEASVDVAVERLRVVLDEVTDPVERIRRGIEGHLTVFDDHADLFSIFNSEKLDSISEELAGKVNALGRDYEDLWVQIIREGMQEGLLRSDLDPWIAMKAVVGLCNSTLLWFTPGGTMSSHEIAQRFADVAIGGLTA